VNKEAIGVDSPNRMYVRQVHKLQCSSWRKKTDNVFIHYCDYAIETRVSLMPTSYIWNRRFEIIKMKKKYLTCFFKKNCFKSTAKIVGVLYFVICKCFVNPILCNSGILLVWFSLFSVLTYNNVYYNYIYHNNSNYNLFCNLYISIYNTPTLIHFFWAWLNVFFSFNFLFSLHK